MTKNQSQDPAKPDRDEEPEQSCASSEIVGRLSRTLASDRNQKFVAGARKLLDEHEEKLASSDPPPSGDEEKEPEKREAGTNRTLMSADSSRDSVTDKEEIDEAATTLTSAVDQMVPILHLSLGMTDAAIKWMKFVAALLGVAILLLVVLVENGIRSANSNKRAADEVGTAKTEIVQIKDELIAIQRSMIDVRKADARREIAAAAEPKLVAGDKPGEVALVAPDVDPEDIERAKKRAEEAVEKGEKPPKLPSPKGTTKISVKLGEGRKEKKEQMGPWPPEQAPPPESSPED